jgi:hypothetical protein
LKILWAFLLVPQPLMNNFYQNIFMRGHGTHKKASSNNSRHEDWRCTNKFLMVNSTHNTGSRVYFWIYFVIFMEKRPNLSINDLQPRTLKKQASFFQNLFVFQKTNMWDEFINSNQNSEKTITSYSFFPKFIRLKKQLFFQNKAEKLLSVQFYLM